MLRGRISLCSIIEWSIKNRLIITSIKQANGFYDTIIKKRVKKGFTLVLIIIRKYFFYKFKKNLVLTDLKNYPEYFKKGSTIIYTLFNILKVMLLTIYLFYRIISILIKELAE